MEEIKSGIIIDESELEDEIEKKHVYLDAVIANPLNPKLNIKAKFMLDTGASGTVIPQKVAEKLQLTKVAVAKSKVAGGDVKVWPVYYVYLYLSGEGITVLAAGSPVDEYLLGVDLMELLHFQLDLAGKKVLKPVKSLKRIKMGKIVWMEGEPWKTIFRKPSSRRSESRTRR